MSSRTWNPSVGQRTDRARDCPYPAFTMEKKRARVITGWRQVVPPKTKPPKAKLTPAPGGKAAPKPPVLAPHDSADERLEAEGGHLPDRAK